MRKFEDAVCAVFRFVSWVLTGVRLAVWGILSAAAVLAVLCLGYIKFVYPNALELKVARWFQALPVETERVVFDVHGRMPKPGDPSHVEAVPAAEIAKQIKLKSESPEQAVADLGLRPQASHATEMLLLLCLPGVFFLRPKWLRDLGIWLVVRQGARKLLGLAMAAMMLISCTPTQKADPCSEQRAAVASMNAKRQGKCGQYQVLEPEPGTCVTVPPDEENCGVQRPVGPVQPAEPTLAKVRRK